MRCPEPQDLGAVYVLLAAMVGLILGRWLGAREDEPRVQGRDPPD